MPTTATKATAAASHVRIRGVTYRLSPLTDGDLAELRLWMENRYIELARRHMPSLEKQEAADLLKHAYDRASQIDIGGIDALRLLQSPEGAVKVLWLSLLHNHPDLKEREVQEMLRDQEVIDEVMAQVERLNKPKRTLAKKVRRRTVRKKRKKK